MQSNRYEMYYLTAQSTFIKITIRFIVHFWIMSNRFVFLVCRFSTPETSPVRRTAIWWLLKCPMSARTYWLLWVIPWLHDCLRLWKKGVVASGCEMDLSGQSCDYFSRKMVAAAALKTSCWPNWSSLANNGHRSRWCLHMWLRIMCSLLQG